MKSLFLLMAMSALMIFVTGCDDSSTAATNGTKEAGTDSHAGHDHSHDHSEHSHTGAHGGHIIELGRNHEFHAELVDDHESGTVTVYMLDGELKTMEINQESITLVITAGDQSKSFELLAQAGNTSEFSLSDAQLLELLEADHASGKLRVTINDKPFTGSFEHHAHDHDHDHDH